VRIGSAVKGVVLAVVWPVTGLAGGAVPSRAPGKYGGSTYRGWELRAERIESPL